MPREDTICPCRSFFNNHVIPRIFTPLLFSSIHLRTVPALYLRGTVCMTSVRVCDELLSAGSDVGGRSLGGVWDTFRAAPQVRLSQKSPSLTALNLCPLGHHHSTLNLPGDTSAYLLSPCFFFFFGIIFRMSPCFPLLILPLLMLS